MIKIRNVVQVRTQINKKILEKRLKFIENLPLEYFPKTYSLDVHFNEREVDIYPLEKLKGFDYKTENIKNCSILHGRNFLRIKEEDNTISYNFYFDPYKEG